MYVGRVLALDIATTTGWAATGEGEKPRCYHFTVDPDGGRALGRALFEFRRQLHILVDRERPTDIAYEAPITERAHGLHASKLIHGMCGLVNLTAFSMDIPVWECSIPTVRRHFLGKGRIPKGTAKQAVFDRCKLLGWRPETFDEADALAVWSYAEATLKGAALMERVC